MSRKENKRNYQSDLPETAKITTTITAQEPPQEPPRQNYEGPQTQAKPKEGVGWWKIVMLVLTCVITLALTLTAVFAGLGVVQIKRIADIPDNITGMIEDFDFFAPDEEYDDEYYSEDEINWDDLFSFFDSEDTDSRQSTPGGKEKGSDRKENSNNGDRTNSADPGEYGNGSDAYTDEEWENMLSDWISSFFGGGSDSGMQGF